MTRIRRINVSQVEGGSADNTDIGQIRPAGETAFYIGDNNKLTLMMFDGVRTHQKSKVLSPGVLFGSNADAGDGSTADTIKLIPDAALFNSGSDQYIVVDPTGGQPGHIHLRAGGTQDSSAANLYLGGEQTFVRVSDTTDNVVIRTTALGNIPIENVNVQTVDELVPPGGVWRLFINDSAYPTLGTTVQIGETVTTAWGTPVTATITDIQQDAGNWQIHVDQNITAGFNPYNTVTFNRGGKSWTFDNGGKLTFPQGGAIEAHGMGWTGFTNAGNGAPLSMAYKDGSTSLSEITLTGGPTEGIVSIYTQDTVTESSYQWIFDNAGKTIFPGGMSITGVGATIQALTGNSINIETNDTQSVSANCAIAVGDEFVADTEFNDDITVVQVGWTVVVDGTTYTVTAIDPAPPAWQYRITAQGATFVQGTTYTFTSPTPVAKTWSFGSTGTLTLPNNAVIRTDGGNVEVGNVTNFNVEATGVVNVYTDAEGTGYQWQFGDDGSLTVPGDLHGAPLLSPGPTPSQIGRVVNITPADDASDKAFRFSIDQLGETFSRAYLQLPEAEVDKQVAAVFPHSNDTAGYIFTQGTNATDDGMNDAFNIFYNNGDIKVTAMTSLGVLRTWKFGDDGALTFPDATVQTTAFTGTGAITFTANEIEGNTFGGTGTIITKTVDNTGNDYSTGSGSLGFLNFGADGNIQNVKAGWTVTFASGITRTVSQDAYQPLGTYWNIGFDSAYTWSAGNVMPVTFSSPDYVAGTDPEVTLTAGAKSWTFDDNGTLTFPGTMAIETTYGGASTLVVDGKAHTVELRSNEYILIGYNNSSGNVYIGNQTSGQVDIVSNKFRVMATVPTSSTGADGDMVGMIAVGGGYLYVCTANWVSPGTANIWTRTALTTGAW